LGFVEIKLPKHPLLLQHYGFFHGGIISYLASISGGLAGISLLDNANMNIMGV
jgi:acyl-coenzyme A thioesterase PaaI-like protein